MAAINFGFRVEAIRKLGGGILDCSPTTAAAREGLPKLVGVGGPADGQAGTLEPVGGIGDIPFDEVKPRMNGIAIGGGEVVHDIVGGIPSLGVATEPEGAQAWIEVWGWRVAGPGCGSKFGEGRESGHRKKEDGEVKLTELVAIYVHANADIFAGFPIAHGLAQPGSEGAHGSGAQHELEAEMVLGFGER